MMPMYFTNPSFAKTAPSVPGATSTKLVYFHLAIDTAISVVSSQFVFYCVPLVKLVAGMWDAKRIA